MKWSCAVSNQWFTVAFGIILSAGSAGATSQSWDGGAGSGLWTANNNWSSNASYPVNDETATFSGAGANYTNISVSGLAAIKYITFDSSGVSQYFLGLEPVNSETLIMRNGGNFRLSSTCRYSQFFNAAIQLGPDRTSNSYTFQNDHLVSTLTFLGDISCPTTSGTAGDKTVYVNGIGNMRFLGNLTRGSANNLDITINNSGTTTMSGTNLVRYLRLYGGSGSVLDIGDGLMVFTNSNTSSLGGENFSSTYGGTITGSGAMMLTTAPGENNSDNYVSDVNSTLAIDCRLTGNVGFELYTSQGIAGTFALNGANDFTGNIFINASGTISARKFGNRYDTDSGLGAGYRIRFSSWTQGGPKLKYTGTGESMDRQLDLNSAAKLEQAGTGNLVFTGPLVATTSSAIPLTLMGSTEGAGEIGSAISNGTSSAISILKEGSGSWSLSGANMFTGSLTVNGGVLSLTRGNRYSAATSINGGSLVLSGAEGAVSNTSAVALSGNGRLVLNNTAAENAVDRLRDAAPVAMNGGSLLFAHSAGSASYSETVGAVTLNGGANTIAASRAAVGQTSALTLSGLTRTAGSVDFVGVGVGSDARNRIFITGQADGLIGPWATVNGSALAAYSSTLGVYPAAATAYTDIAARGPSSTIPDAGATSAVRINSDGVSGNIELAAATTTIGSLSQNTATDATVDTAGKTLRATALIVPSGKASVTVGAAPGDGTLKSAEAGGGVSLVSEGAAPLTINAVVADNASASGLNKSGAGTAVLAAANTFTGPTTISGGSLVLADGGALQGSPVALTTLAPVFDAGVSGHAFTFGGLSGSLDLALSDNGGNPVALTVGDQPADTEYSGSLSGEGQLVKRGAGTLTLSGANAHLGGTVVEAGSHLTVAHAQALGNGPVVNDGTMNLTVAPATYSGLSGLSGSGTNLLTVMNTVSTTTYLNNDFSAFTGRWEIGPGVGTTAGKVQMNGADHPAATVVVRTNATLYCSTATRHVSTIILQGGNTGEANGQLRLDNSSDWAGPVHLDGTMTDSNDGLIGSASGTGYISGEISDGGSDVPLNKTGGGTLALLNPNNSFGGPLWVRQGWVRAATMRNVGETSALGAPDNAGDGTIKMGNGTTTAGLAYIGSGDTSDRVIDMASSTATIYLDHSGSNVWRLTGGVVSSAAGNKRLQLQGSTAGATGEVAGIIADYSEGATNNLFKSGTGAWTLSGNNTFKGNVVVDNGILRITHDRALGVGPKIAQAANNQNNANPHIHLDGTAGDLTIPADITFRTSNSRVGAIFNDGGNNTILGPVQLVAGDGDTILNSASGKLTLAGSVYPPSDTGRNLRLWGAGDGEISGVIADGMTVNLPVYKERGTGTWTLSGANTYGGFTTVNNGALALAGPDGRIVGGADLGESGTLIVTNSPAVSNGDRLADGSAVKLNGGTFRFAHSGGAVDYSETVGALTVGSGGSTLEASRADEGQTSTLTFSSLTRTGSGSVNFVGEGLGDADNRNRILFTTPPVSDDALIGPWAMYNGTNLASYTVAEGVKGADETLFSNLSAKGPSVIPNDAATVARIAEEGTSGGIALAADGANSVAAILQATAWDAEVGMTNGQSLKASSVIIGSGMAGLTLGTNATDGAVMALAAGGTLTLANHSADADLTVNAPLTNNTSASSLSKVGAGRARLNGVVAYSGPTDLAEGELVYAANSLTQTLSGVISGKGRLVKEGSGRIDLAVANTYEGETVVRGGTLMPKNNAALGSTLVGTVITNGGTLDVGYSGSAQAVNFGNELFTISGAGVNDRGAVINSSALSQYNAIRFMALAGDATVGCENSAARWDVRNTDTKYPAYLDMNGFTMAKVGAGLIGLTSVSVFNPGAIDIREGSFTTEAGTVLNGNSNNVMTVQNGATFDIYSMTTPIWWTLVMMDGGRFYSRAGSGETLNVWAGPVELNGASRLDAASGTTLTLAGEVGGSGTLVKVNTGTAYLTGTNNYYGGGTRISNGWLRVTNPGALPSYATPESVQVSAGAGLYLNSGDGTTGWTAEQINDLHASGAFLASNSIMAIDTTLADVSGVGGLYGFALYKYGTNTLTLTGVNTNRPVTATGEHSNLRVYGGKLVLSSESSNVFGRCYVLPGAGGAKLEINGETRFADSLYVGNYNGDRSTVEINTNVTMYRAWVGINQVSSGALIQNSGAVDAGSTSGGTQIFEIGRDGAYGYYRLNGGSLRTGQFALGGGSGNATTYNCGVFDLFDGDVTLTHSSGWLIWGWVGGNGVANLYGGKVTAPPGGNFVSMAHSSDRGSFGMLNLLGAGAFLDTAVNQTSRGLNVANASGNLMSVVNLNAGTILANRVYAASTGTPSYFNFGGGRLLANATSGYASSFLQGLTAATVYPGGAVLDTTNTAVTVNQPLLAPEGCGIVSIPVVSGGAGYIGAPVVMISGGSGFGATAVASVDLDESSVTYGQVTSVQVTSPGTGYQPGDPIAVSLIRGGYTAIAQTGAPVLAPNATSGGLVKVGSGSLTLGGQNTYGGETVIRNGTLRLGVANALPADADVTLEGGIYDVNGFDVTNGTLSATSGSVINGTLRGDALTKTGSGTFTVGVPMSVGGWVRVEGGELLLAQPGLYEGSVDGTYMNSTTSNPATAIRLNTRMANVGTAYWPSNTTYIYTGYLWNRAQTNETWTFAESFDDGVLLKIDGATVLNDGAWNTPTKGDYVLTPGAHPIDVRFFQGTGGAGPINTSWWKTSAFGFGVDVLGRGDTNIANYVALADVGDGGLLTVHAAGSAGTNLLDAASSVAIAAGATLNLGGNSQTLADLSGEGVVSNGTLILEGVVTPGGEDSLGELTLACSAELRGTLSVDVSADACDALVVDGDLTLGAGATLTIANPEQMNHGTTYTVARTSGSGTRSGTFTTVNVPDKRWHVVYAADGSVKLVFSNGCVLMLR